MLSKPRSGAGGIGQEVSLADLIVLGGGLDEKAAKDARLAVTVPSRPAAGRAQERTDAATFALLEPRADSFRNYIGGEQHFMMPRKLVDGAQLMT